MKSLAQIQLNPAIKIIEVGLDGGSAYWKPTKSTRPAVIIFSFGGGWDHVSVSFKSRCPSWDEMCMVKDMFFNEDETVIQYHPAKEDYINQHPYCLHLWKPHAIDLPKPPTFMIGIKGMEANIANKN